MMDVNAYADYLVSLNLSERAVAILTAVRPGADGKPKPPVRAVGSRVGNSNVRYPSRKMGFVIECESGRPEYFAAMNFEFDPDVLEYYSQPDLLTLHYVSAGGRNLSVPYVPDFIVLRTNGVEFVECKSADGIAAQALEQPNRFKKTDGGEWLSPPAEAAVSGSGIDYRIWLPTDLTPQFAANLKYLDPHIRRSPNAYGTEEYARVLAYVQEHQGVTVDALVEKFGEQEAPALVRWLLAHSHLFCNLHKEFLLGTTGLFTSRDLVMATKYFKVGDTGWPVGLAGSVPSVSEQMSSAISYAYKHFGSVAFGVANWRLAILEGRLTPAKRPAERTLSLWKKRMANAEKRHGVGFLGLLPGYAGQGNRNPRIPDAVVAMADDVIKESYLVTAGMKRASAYRQFLARCVENCLGPIPSVPWFYERAAAAATPAQTVLARQGPRAAYALLPGHAGRVGALDVHGDYPLHNVLIDHTQLDLEVVSPLGLNLGRPWLTVAFDSFTRSVLGIFLTFDPPSIDSVLMVLRDCVLRHELLPFGLTVDNGAEFRSTWFETFTAMYKMVVSRRPPRHARFGCLVENFFGVNNSQFIHALAGNTQLTKNVRQLTKSLNPELHAVWTLPALYQVLETYCFEHFNKKVVTVQVVLT